MPLSRAALQVYETLRTEVIAGRARPEELCDAVHHGLLRGATVLLSSQVSPDATAHWRYRRQIRRVRELAMWV